MPSPAPPPPALAWSLRNCSQLGFRLPPPTTLFLGTKPVSRLPEVQLRAFSVQVGTMPSSAKRRKQVPPWSAGATRRATRVRAHASWVEQLSVSTTGVIATAVVGLVVVAVAVFMVVKISGRDKGHVRVRDTRLEASQSNASLAPVYGYDVVLRHRHDMNAFTQGLIFENGWLYESSGGYGDSDIRRVDVVTGEVVQVKELARDVFAEGLASDRAGKLFLLSWKNEMGFVLDRSTLDEVGRWVYDGPGWGAAIDAHEGWLYMSNGSSVIRKSRVEDPGKVVSEMEVRDGGVPINFLNEMEWVAGELWCNVWYTELIARVDPGTGQVRSWINAAGLLQRTDIPRGHRVDVLNGIAYDASRDRVFVTGKKWPFLYQIRVGELQSGVTAKQLAGFLYRPEDVATVRSWIA
mmetsp:Transcript_6181/g.12087  ORF Transcript_6181/g.12087 Transcript_6181/m.12087 type:complete len:407 (-) Transcript_6181:231-1451(-)